MVRTMGHLKTRRIAANWDFPAPWGSLLTVDTCMCELDTDLSAIQLAMKVRLNGKHILQSGGP